MAHRLLSALALVGFGALAGCGFDFGGESPTTERTAISVTTDDAGVQTIVGSNGCVFQPCSGAYGTQCGVICPHQ